MFNIKYLLAVLLILVFPTVHAAEESYGTVLGDYNGVTIYSNSKIGRPDSAGYGVYQCVEFVKRYYREFFQITLPAAGDANQYFSKAKSLGLSRYGNGSSSVKPQPGDVLVSEGNSSIEGNVGHVAIVRSVSSNQVCVVEQNFLNAGRDADGTHCMLLSGDSSSGYSVGQFGTNYPIAGWLRPTCEASLEKPCKIKSPKNIYMGWYPRTNLCQDATQWFVLGSENGKKTYSGVTDVSACPLACYAN